MWRVVLTLVEALRKEGIEPTGGPVRKVKESLEEW